MRHLLTGSEAAGVKVKRRWRCPNCGALYYIRPKTMDEWAIIESIQVAGFALRCCSRCAYVMAIKPREESTTPEGDAKQI